MEKMANSSSSHVFPSLTPALAHRAEVLENPLQTYLLGIIISICGNVLISISLNIQKYAHVRQAQRGSKPYYTSATWWCGVVLMGVGELGNFAAYGFAPASLIAPLGCVSVIASAIISVVFLKETLCASDIVVYRDRHLLPSALSVQEEEHEAHRHCDAAGGPARLSDSDLSQSRVRDDHRVDKRPAAAHLPHLLRHVCCHGCFLRLPDQISQSGDENV
uniref:NIPA-like protein 2 n=1 Tax=Astatotilapia calliptera TaxID=8154 RepID=A0A3P8PGC6_ASTCA